MNTSWNYADTKQRQIFSRSESNMENPECGVYYVRHKIPSNKYQNSESGMYVQ